MKSAFARGSSSSPTLHLRGINRDKLLYHHLRESLLENIRTLADFAQHSTRELTAEDYVYQIKRLAHPRVHSPIFGLMTDYSVGLKEYGELLKQVNKHLNKSEFLKLQQYSMEGVEVMDRYTYRIRLKGKYLQLLTGWPCYFLLPCRWRLTSFIPSQGFANAISTSTGTQSALGLTC